MKNNMSRNDSRKKRHARIRNRVFGVSEKPRMVVFRSQKHIYAQVIDDAQGKTLAAANTLQKEVKDKIKDEMSNMDIAKVVGGSLAEKSLKAGVESVVFDRAGYKYHGRIAALAEGARKGGLKF